MAGMVVCAPAFFFSWAGCWPCFGGGSAGCEGAVTRPLHFRLGFEETLAGRRFGVFSAFVAESQHSTVTMAASDRLKRHRGPAANRGQRA